MVLTAIILQILVSNVLFGFLIGICLAIFIQGYIAYYRKNRKGGTKQRPIELAVRDADEWTAKKAALEEKYGLVSKEICLTHYKDDVADNVFCFDDSQTLLLKGEPVPYAKIERATLEFAGEYVIKIWVEGLESHYLTLSTDNGRAANELKDKLDQIAAKHVAKH